MTFSTFHFENNFDLFQDFSDLSLELVHVCFELHSYLFCTGILSLRELFGIKMALTIEKEEDISGMSDSMIELPEDDMTKLIASFRQEGELIGLTSAKLTSYIQERLAEYRKQKERKEEFLMQAKRLRQEKALKEAQFDQERVLTEQDRALKVRELDQLEQERAFKERELDQDRALKERELDQKRVMKEKELGLKEAELAMNMKKIEQDEKIAQERRSDKEKDKNMKGRPKLPYFDEKHDEMESHLFRFEKHATMMSWQKDDWSGVLSTLLKGKALSYFHELPIEEALTYDKLSAHLLKRFQCTEEGFRNQFRSAKPETTENMLTFFARRKRLFSRWIELATVNKDYDRLVELFLREQFLSSCAGSLVTFLKEVSLRQLRRW